MGSLILNITNDCNMRCKYCTFGDKYPYAKSYDKSKMSFYIMKKGMEYLFSHAKKSEKVYISFYGGEPLLYFDIIKKGIKYAKALGQKYNKSIKFKITTNFTSVTKEMMQFFIENGVNLTISLNGPKEIHDRERIFKNGSGTFDVIMQNLRTLYRLSSEYLHSHVTYAIVITPPFEILTVRDFFNSFPYKTRNLLIITLPSPHDTTYYKNMPSTIWKDYQQQLENLKREFIEQIHKGMKPDWFTFSFFKGILYRIHTRFVGKRDYMYPNGAGIPGATRCYLSTDGIYYPCEKVWERLPIGDVKHGINKRRVCYIYSRFIEICESQCLDCWANGLCYLCYNRALEFKNGRNVLSMEKKGQYCDDVKNTLKKALIFYTDIMEATGGNLFNTFKLSSTNVKDECKI